MFVLVCSIHNVPKLNSDYADILFCKANKKDIDKLQMLQNKCLRICLGKERRFDMDRAHKLTNTVTGQNPPDMYPPDTYPKDMYPLVTYPLDTYPLDTYPLGLIPPGHLPPGHLSPGQLPPRTYTPQDIYPPDFKMAYLVHASCVDYILHFKKHLFCRNSIYL